jgi:hypothetical protein
MSRTFGEFDPRFLGVSLAVSSAKRADFPCNYALGPETMTDSDASGLDDDEFIEQISWITVLPHEFRHFHDHIVSPYGSRAMHARCVLAFNTTMLLAGIYKDQGSASANTLPAPLSAWCRTPKAEREGFLAELEAATIGHRPDGGHDHRAPRRDRRPSSHTPRNRFRRLYRVYSFRHTVRARYC